MIFPLRMLLGWCALATLAMAAPIPDDFPRFIVPGHEAEMDAVRALYWRHYEHAGPLITLWDEWMASPTLWPARGEGAALDAMRARWAAALASRGMNSEGYFHTHQHDGLGHAEGWPFPLWTQAGGIGWHFRGTGISGYDGPAATSEGFQLAGAVDADSAKLRAAGAGWVVDLTSPEATVETPAFAVAARVAPWLRLNWYASALEGDGKCYVEWTTDESPEFSSERRVEFDAATPGDDGQIDFSRGETRTMIPVYRHAGWTGTITGLRIGFHNAGRATVVIKSFHTASDTRHNINNLAFIRGCRDYFMWSRDVPFLRSQMGRIRTAMRFVEREFQTRERLCMYTTWPGHEGRSGVRVVDGEKQVVPGEGVGSNYWDLLPFGGEDALATVYYYGALLDLAELEEAVAAQAERREIEIPPLAPPFEGGGLAAYDPADLRAQAAKMKSHAGRRFWNERTGRFGTIDLDGAMHDYGFTFLNNEAVCYGFATPEQAVSIHAWLSGERTVAGDTAVGDDVYHWRFGPRATTRRNTDYYFWGWSNPESIPWGGQVQDGGAVLGFSYHDLMARLKTAGPDDAAARLAEIVGWYEEVEAAGGYRAYYAADPARGTLQGGGTAGGLGMDHEFFESILVPQVMLSGFLGFEPTANGCTINPRLPSDWPSLAVTRIHLHDRVLNVTATAAGEVVVTATAGEPLTVRVGEQEQILPASAETVRIVPLDR
jgi:hypothetical protein